MIPQLKTRLHAAAYSLKTLAATGIIKPYAPGKLAGTVAALSQWGLGPAGGFIALAARAPQQVGIIDELGELTWGELHRRSNSIARGLAALGVKEGDGVALMARNHRGFIEASLAIAKLGADALYLNTAFAAPQLVEVLDRDQVVAIILDQEFDGLLSQAPEMPIIHAWTDDDRADGVTLEKLIAAYDDGDLTPPGRHSRTIILTSGTTGTPKGAPRSEAGIDAAVALLSRMPLKHGWRTHIAAPMFHTWGFAHLALAMLMSSTIVLTRKFDPEHCLRLTQDQRCESMAVIPVMLQRILNLPQDTLDSFDLSRVKVVAASGSALPGDLAIAWMDQFGDNLYNIYGSTEVAYASIAMPSDLREAPSSAGKPPFGTVVKILDEDGREVVTGEPGRIFVGNSLLFEGYTGGGGKEIVDGLMCSGDVGRFGDDGRLYVEGRDDEMIVSGGENVFPKEIEDALARHDDVVEAAAIGVDDAEFGQRLKAFVVTSSQVSEDDLKDWVKQNLARYKVPREIVFLDELPRNSTGKILKRELHGRKK